MKPQPVICYHQLRSKVLENNFLGDLPERRIVIYLPLHYDEKHHYPLLMALAPYNSSGLALVNWHPDRENLPTRLDSLILSHKMPPCIVVFPDCFTRLRGNQYINSSVIGDYQTFLIDEVIPFVESHYPTGGSGFRACFGKSSGGFGAITYGMARPDIWSAVACHSGGMGFQWLVSGYVPLISMELSGYDYKIEPFIRHIEKAHKLTHKEFITLMFLSFCAAYDPDPSSSLGNRLPFDLYTGQGIKERSQNWLTHDPAFPSQTRILNLSLLKALYIDCGSFDQYHLQFGARILHKTLSDQKVKHLYEEFPDNHTDLEYRYDVSLPFLVKGMLDNKEFNKTS